MQQDTEFKDDSLRNRGTNIDLERDLDLDDDFKVFRFGGHYRFKPRHKFAWQYYEMEQNGKLILLEDLNIGDNTFPAGTTVATDFDWEVIKLQYMWSFIQKDKLEIAFSTGIYNYDVDVTIESRQIRRREEADVDVKFPIVGFRVNYLISERWMLKTGLDVFDIDTNDTEVRVVDLGLVVEYSVAKHFGVGFGLIRTEMDVEDGRDGEEYDLDYNGSTVYLKFMF